MNNEEIERLRQILSDMYVTGTSNNNSEYHANTLQDAVMHELYVSAMDILNVNQPKRCTTCAECRFITTIYDSINECHIDACMNENVYRAMESRDEVACIYGELENEK